MHKLHNKILDKVKEVSKLSTPNFDSYGLKYVGTNKSSYHLNTKDTQSIAKKFLKENNLSTQQLHDVIGSLYSGKT